MPDIHKGSLRTIGEKDLGQILEWRNSDRIRNSMLSNHIISWEEHQSWFKKLKTSDIYLIFEYEDEPAGLVNFTEMMPSEGSCWWGFYLGKNDLPKGTGLLMGYKGLSYIFHKINIRLVYSKVLERNTASLTYHKRLGFSEDDSDGQYNIRDNERLKVVYFSYRYENWLNYKLKLKKTIEKI